MIVYGKITITSIAYTYYLDNQIYTPLVDEFNKYSKQNNLDINLTLKSMTTENFSLSIENSQMMFDNLVRRKKSQYDIYIYDAAWTPKYCSHFIDLSKELSKSHIKYFNDSILKELNQCGDKIAGLVC